jgi:predicted RNA-binding protein
MCESSVFIEKGDTEELILKDAIFIRPDDGSVYIEDILGDSKDVKGKIKFVDLANHKVILTVD